jgi:hypothetical protein
MTGHAQAGRVLIQKEFRRRSMRSVTFKTTVDIADNGMLVCGILRDFLYVLVAGVAKKRSDGFDHFSIAGAVRIVAADTIVLSRLVHNIELLQLLGRNLMARETKR